MLTNVSRADLNRMDLGAHIQLLEEWNEDAGFIWGPATITHTGYYTVVTQEDGLGALIVATYVANGEGDIRALRIYTSRSPFGDEYLQPLPYNKRHTAPHTES